MYTLYIITKPPQNMLVMQLIFNIFRDSSVNFSDLCFSYPEKNVNSEFKKKKLDL